MTAAHAYLRVSSRAQDAASQKSAIERVAASRGDTISTWYSEKKSAKTMDRAELKKLRQDARLGTVTKLYVFRLDRLTRSGIRDTFELIEELRHHGVQLVSVADGFDLEGPAAEVVLAVLAWASRMERLALGERIAAARERVEAEGGSWGRPQRMDAETISKARKLRAEGRSLRAVAIALKIPKSTLAATLAPSRKPPSKANRADPQIDGKRRGR